MFKKCHLNSGGKIPKEMTGESPPGSCINCHKSHEEHPDVGLGVLKKKLERLQNKIEEGANRSWGRDKTIGIS